MQAIDAQQDVLEKTKTLCEFTSLFPAEMKYNLASLIKLFYFINVIELESLKKGKLNSTAS